METGGIPTSNWLKRMLYPDTAQRAMRRQASSSLDGVMRNAQKDGLQSELIASGPATQMALRRTRTTCKSATSLPQLRGIQSSGGCGILTLQERTFAGGALGTDVIAVLGRKLHRVSSA